MTKIYGLVYKCIFTVLAIIAFFGHASSQCTANVNTVNSQVLCNGSATAAINFSGVANRYAWTNSNPSIGLAASGNGNIPSFTALNTGNVPVTATISVVPVKDPFAYIANNGSNTVSVINTFTNAVVATIPVGSSPAAICVSPDDSKVYVTNSGSNSVSVISTATNTVISTIPVGIRPEGIAIQPGNLYLYVTNSGSNSVSVIKVATGIVETTIPVGSQPYGIAVSSDGSKVVVANYGSNTVSIINAQTNSVSGTMNVGAGPLGIAIIPNGTEAYVTNNNSNTVSRIYLPNNYLVQNISGFSGPMGVTATNDRIYVANNAGNTVSVINYNTSTIIATIGMGSGPVSVDLAPIANRAYVTNLFSNSVSIIDLSSNVVTATIPVGSNPTSLGKFITTKCTGNPIQFNITVQPTPTANAIANQTVCGGDTQPAINLMGTGTSYSWTNSDPSIGLAASGTGNIPAFTTSNIANTPVTANITVTPLKQPLAYFASDNNIVVVNTGTNNTVATIPVGNNPKGIAVSPDGSKVYVTTADNGKLAVINTATNTVDANITVGNNPSGVVVSPDGSRVYVATSPNGINSAGAIKVVNTATNAVIASVATSGNDPRGMALSPSGMTLYVALYGSAKVDVMNTNSNSIIAGLASSVTPYSVAISPDFTRVYVTCATPGFVYVYDAANSSFLFRITVGSQPQSLCVLPNGSRLYVTNLSSNNVTIISSAGAVMGVMNGFSGPFGISANADGSKLYVCNTGSSSVSIVNTTTNAISSTIPFGASVQSFGNFIHQVYTCPGPPAQFSIKVNPPSVVALATSNVSFSRNVVGKTYFNNDCIDGLICAVNPSGTNPISGTTTSRVWIEATQPNQYVKRHYEITPATDTETATGKVTLYFTQQEFNDFNAVNTIKLPNSLSDATGKANLLIEKRPGTSSNGSGLPNTYVGTPVTINPDDADIVWNATRNRWEITFDVTGFSGFFVKTQSAVLPVSLISFNGTRNGNANTLKWHVSNEINLDKYEVESSRDGSVFSAIGAVAAANNSNYFYTDKVPGWNQNNLIYYRLKMTDIDGSIKYSSVIKLEKSKTTNLEIYPNPVKDMLTINGLVTGDAIKLFDASGKLIMQKAANTQNLELNVSALSSGMYYLRVQRNNGTIEIKKVVK